MPLYCCKYRSTLKVLWTIENKCNWQTIPQYIVPSQIFTVYIFRSDTETTLSWPHVEALTNHFLFSTKKFRRLWQKIVDKKLTNLRPLQFTGRLGSKALWTTSATVWIRRTAKKRSNWSIVSIFSITDKHLDDVSNTFKESKKNENTKEFELFPRCQRIGGNIGNM